MTEMNFKWGNLKDSMEQKLKFLEKMHRKHQEEVKDYMEHSDNLDKEKFHQKLKKATFELYTDQKDVKKTNQQMEQEREKLRVYLERARRDYEDEKKYNQDLIKRLADIDGSTTETNQKL